MFYTFLDNYWVLAVVQLVFLLHAIRHRAEYWWYFIILFVPVVGAAAYLFAEVLPAWQHRRPLQRASSALLRAVDPERDIRRLREEIDLSDTLDNRRQLALAYEAAGRLEEAIGIYRECLQNPVYQDDPMLLYGLARATFARADLAGTEKALLELRELHPHYRPLEVQLLLARTYEGASRMAEAAGAYEPLVNRYPGEEARCRFGLMLWRQGETDRARALFKEVLVTARRSPRHYRQAQKAWVQLARKHSR